MRSRIAVLAACLACLSSEDAGGQAWEFLGPDVGYRPEAFFVTDQAIYLGLADPDYWTGGLGLYRYRLDQGSWELFAWEGDGVTGISVWGDSDENILLVRYRDENYTSYVYRSTDGGGTWIEVYRRFNSKLEGMTQAPSDTARAVIHFPVSYTTNGGWSWAVSGGGVPWNGTFGVSFDPSNALVAYLTGGSEFGVDRIYKSTTGGARWFSVFFPIIHTRGICVERWRTNRVMAGTSGAALILTTDAGASWWTPITPFRTHEVCSPPWFPSCYFVAGSDSDQTRFEVRRTTDFGETWFPCGSGLPTLPEPTLLGTNIYMVPHPTEPVLYLALEGSGVWRWRYDGASGPDVAQAGGAPRLFAYPVPASDRLTCGVHLSREAHVSLRLLDLQGRLVGTLQEGSLPAGTHVFGLQEGIGWGMRPPSGVYYLKLASGGAEERRKVVLAR